MISVDAENNAPEPARFAEDIHLSPPAAVQEIDLEDESFSPSFRTENPQALKNSRTEEFEILRSFLARHASSGPFGMFLSDGEIEIRPGTGQVQVTAASAAVRDELRKIAQGLSSPIQRERFLNPALSDKELIEVLHYASPQSRLDFARTLLRLGESNGAVGEFVRDKFDNAAHYLWYGERAAVIDELLKKPQSDYRDRAIAATLRESDSITQLTFVVERVGVDRLLQTANAEIREYVAHAVLSPQVRRVELPVKLGTWANSEETNRAFDRLEKALNQVISTCASDARLSETQVAKDFIHTALEDIADLARVREKYKAYLPLFRSEANLQNDIIRLELHYGVNLTSGTFKHSQTGETIVIPWFEEDIRDIADVLAKIPNGDLTFAAKLREIRKVLLINDNPGILGVRLGNTGVIELALGAFENQFVSAEYNGVSSLRIVLAHELGHAIQIGSGFSGYYYDPEGNFAPEFADGEYLYDFDEFVALSKWQGYAPNKVEKLDGNWIKLDGARFELGTPVVHDGARKVFLYDEQTKWLFSYGADAGFSAVSYSRTSPWEDFAEAFSEYLYLPERLIQKAPEKFLHLELEFKTYETDARIMNLLKDALSRRTVV